MRLVTVNLVIDPESGLKEEFDNIIENVSQSEWWFWINYCDDEPRGLCCVYGYQDPNNLTHLLYSKEIEVDGHYHLVDSYCEYDEELFALTNNTDDPEFLKWFNKLDSLLQMQLTTILPF